MCRETSIYECGSVYVQGDVILRMYVCIYMWIWTSVQRDIILWIWTTRMERSYATNQKYEPMLKYFERKVIVLLFFKIRNVIKKIKIRFQVWQGTTIDSLKRGFPSPKKPWWKPSSLLRRVNKSISISCSPFPLFPPWDEVPLLRHLIQHDTSITRGALSRVGYLEFFACDFTHLHHIVLICIERLENVAGSSDSYHWTSRYVENIATALAKTIYLFPFKKKVGMHIFFLKKRYHTLCERKWDGENPAVTRIRKPLHTINCCDHSCMRREWRHVLPLHPSYSKIRWNTKSR